MSHISDERKEALLRKYGNNTANAAGRPAGGPPLRMGGPGPGGRRPGGPGGQHGAIGGGKPKNANAVIRRLFNYIGRDGVKIPLVFACVLCSSFASLGGSYILRPVINNLVNMNRTAEAKVKNLLTGILLWRASTLPA